MGEFRKQLRNWRDETLNGRRVCDIVVNKGTIALEFKTKDKKIVQIPWDDIVMQVNAAKDMSEQLNQQ